MKNFSGSDLAAEGSEIAEVLVVCKLPDVDLQSLYIEEGYSYFV